MNNGRAVPKINWDIPYLEELYKKDMPMKDRWLAYTSCHPERMTFGSFKSLVTKLGFRNREYVPFYTEEQKEFLIKTYPTNGAEDTTYLFNSRYGTNKSKQSIKAACVKWGIHVDKETKIRDRRRVHSNARYEVGDVTTLRRDGRLTPVVVTERIDSPGARGSRYHYTSLIRHTYEKAYGKLDKGYKVIPLDGDMFNNSLDNLKAVPTHYVVSLARWNEWYGKGEITGAAIEYLNLTEAIKKETKRINEGNK